MTNSLLKNNSKHIQNGDGIGKNFSNLNFPSEHQVVIIDAETEKAQLKYQKVIPLTFSIDYKNSSENPPSLIMLVNPQNMSISSDKKINSEFSRGGYVIEDWGDMQDIITFTGKIGGYYILNPRIGFSGLNRYERSKSLSFKNLMNLFLIYRNNGAVFEKTVKNPERGSQDRLISNSGLARINDRIPKITQNAKNRISYLGDISLSYDNIIYKGSFDDFSIEENADQPYLLNYKFSFIVHSKNMLDYRPLELYTQQLLEMGDITKDRLSTSQLESAQKQTARSLDIAINSTNPSNTNSNIIIPQLPPEVNLPRNNLSRNQVSELAAKTHSSSLSSKGLNIAPEDSLDIRKNMSELNSVDASNSNSGFNKLIETHIIILGKNGKENNSETQKEALNLSLQAKKTLSDTKK